MRQSLWPRSLTRTAQPGSPGSGLSFLKAGPGEPRHDCRRTSPGLWRSCRKKYNRWGSLYLLKIIVHPEGPSQPRDPEKPATRADSRSRGVLGVARAARESLQQRAMAPRLRENLLFWEWICSLPCPADKPVTSQVDSAKAGLPRQRPLSAQQGHQKQGSQLAVTATTFPERPREMLG